MNDLRDIMRKRVASAGVAGAVQASLFIEAAQKVLDDFFGTEPQLVRALYLKNRTLTVSVAAAPVAQELKKNEVKLLEQMRVVGQEPSLERIRYLL